MTRVVVLDVVGLTSGLMGEATPNLSSLGRTGSFARIEPAFPAVTCTAQSNYLTGKMPSEHGVVGNGWYDRDLAEVHFWKQSNRLVQARKLWEDLRSAAPEFSCANLFWWFNMYSSVDWSVTPRPIYPADGRKLPDIYTWPYPLRNELMDRLGPFPFLAFWGPAAGLESSSGAADAASRWIANAAMLIEELYSPTLSLVYLPHLDYALQRVGPRSDQVPSHLRAIDEIVGELLDFFRPRGIRVIVLSEYGIVPVDRSIDLNRSLRQAGWLVVKEELGREILDAGNSAAFAVADHQVAHVYVKERALVDEVRDLIGSLDGVGEVLDPAMQADRGLAHRRSGDLVILAKPHRWFSYYYWLDEDKAPDFARTVDIHRKPGYDPVELFTDPRFSRTALRFHVAKRMLQRSLGFRMLMDVVPLDASLVKGSHGLRPESVDEWPVLLSDLDLPDCLHSTEVSGLIRRAIQCQQP